MLGGVPLTADRVDRSFLFNVMNTLDPNFFPGSVSEIEMRQIKKNAEGEDTVLKVDSRMLSLLKQYVQTHKVKNKRASIALVKPNSKKRKRSKLRDLIELKT